MSLGPLNFTAANGTTLQALHPVFSGSQQDFEIQGNRARGTGNFDNSRAWARDLSPAPDQHVELRYYGASPAARTSGSGSTYGGYVALDNKVQKWVNGGYSDLGATYSTVSSGALLAIRVTGQNPTTVEVYVDGALHATRTDSSSPILSGTYGMFGWMQAEADDFYAYEVSSGPTITSHPSNQTVTAPTAATFSVAATSSGGGTLSYQWRRNGSNLSGATSSSYTTPATSVTGGTANNGDAYTAVVTETGGTSPGSVTSSAATLTVNANPSVPTLTSVNGGSAVTDGQTGIAVVGTNLTGGVFDLVDGSITSRLSATINSATSATIAIALGDCRYGNRQLRVTTANGTATIALTVNPPAGKVFVNVAGYNASTPGAITATPPIVDGNQVEASNAYGWDISGLTLNPSLTFNADSRLVWFDARVHNGTRWSATARQLLQAGANRKRPATQIRSQGATMAGTGTKTP